MARNKTLTEITEDGITYTFPSNGNPNSVKGERSYECDICSMEWHESDIRFFRGVAYGIPCGCYKDIPSIIRKEQETYESNGEEIDYGRY
jgi:hypothetical protein